MKRKTIFLFLNLVLVACCSTLFAQSAAQSQSASGHVAPSGNQQKNVQEYINLLRSNVRQEKSQIMGAIMALDPDEAAKFWPIYNEYDRALTKLNDSRAANIQDYARNYDAMTDAKADELIQRALDYRRQRNDLLAKYYERVKASLGSIQAARSLQVENQLLEIIDLQIESSLPIASQATPTKGE